MHTGFMCLRARRTLHTRAIATCAGMARSDRRGDDAPLLEACRAFSRLEQRKIRMLKANNDDDIGAEIALAGLCVEQDRHIRRMCDARAVTERGHRVRALAFASWDAGDLAYRADACGATEDLILLAMIRDLTRGGDW